VVHSGVSIDGGLPRRIGAGRVVGNAMALVISDSLMLLLAMCLAKLALMYLRHIPFNLTSGVLIIPSWLVVASIARLIPGWGLGLVEEIRRVQFAMAALFGIVLLVSFVAKVTLSTSRIVYLLTYLCGVMLIPLGRAISRSILIRMGQWGCPVVVYGGRRSVQVVIEALRQEPSLGYIPSAVFTDELSQGQMVEGVAVLGSLKNTTRRAGVAIVALQDASRRQLIQTLEGPLQVYRKVIMVPDLVDSPSLWVVPRDLQGILGLEITRNLLNPFARFVKRSCDLSLVLLTTPLWIPLMLVLILAIWLEDRKNPIFLQSRLGLKRRTFKTCKFRTMVPDAEKVLQRALQKDPALKAEWDAHYKLKKDPRITKVGCFLRKTSLDEIPQILNVLTGDMSLVGPRPLPAYHFEELPERVQVLRDQVRPGITGLWQVSGRSESGTAGMEKWDPYYVRNWSIWLDLVIIIRTFKAVLFAHGAY
jgi:Undecaprenyl-phosphate galactose phosphotransferase WbaP